MIEYRHNCPTFKNKYILKAPKGWGKSEHRAILFGLMKKAEPSEFQTRGA